MDNHTTTDFAPEPTLESRIDAEIALAAATPSAVDPETIFLSGSELGKRWQMTANGALGRAQARGLPLLKNASGFKAVRLVDVEALEDGTVLTTRKTPAPKPFSFAAPEPVAEQIIDQVMNLRPIPHFEAVQVGDSQRVRRLLKALAAIREILTEEDKAPGFAAWAVADYAISAETDNGD